MVTNVLHRAPPGREIGDLPHCYKSALKSIAKSEENNYRVFTSLSWQHLTPLQAILSSLITKHIPSLFIIQFINITMAHVIITNSQINPHALPMGKNPGILRTYQLAVYHALTSMF